MVQALVSLKEETNKVLNIVKAKHGLKDKAEAIEFVVNKFVELEEPELKPEFIERIRKAEKGKFIKVKDFAKHYGA